MTRSANTTSNRMHKLITLVVAFVFFAHTSAQEMAVFEHYTTKNGITSNRIYDLTQDSLGFIWMTTDYGINRYDGEQFEQFKRSDYPTLARDEILTVKAYGSNVFAGSSAGLLVRYDYDRRNFKTLKPEEFDTTYYKEVRGFYLPDGKEQYVFTVGGIYLYDKEADNFTASIPSYRAMMPLHLRSMFVDSHKRFWVGTVDCLLVFDHDGNPLRNFESMQKARDYVTDILEYEQGKILVTFFTNEVWLFDTETDSISNPQIIETPFSNVTHVAKDHNGRYWFSTDGYGLWYSDKVPSSFSDFKQIMPYGASPNDIKKIYSMIVDRQGDVWIGTQSTGLWRYRQNHSGVTFSSSIGFPEIVCASFAEDKNGNIYVATDGDGVYKLSPDYSKIERTSLRKGNILSLNWTPDSSLLVATWGDGILRLDTKNDKTYTEELNGISSPLKCLLKIAPAYDGKYWAASAGDGIYVRRKKEDWYKITLTDDKIEIPDNWVMKCAEGKPGVFWAMTTRSLWRIEGDKRQSILEDAIKQKSYNSTSFIDGACDDQGNIFAVSNNGITRVEHDGSKVEELDFVPRELTCAIHHVGGAQFWISSASGITMFDYNAKTTKTFATPFEDKGKSYFYSRSSFADSKGRLYFGTKDGFVVINPNATTSNAASDYLAWADLSVSGKTISPYEGLLSNGPLCNIKNLKLPYDQTEITITFDKIDFIDPQSTTCEYRLVGLNDEWKQLGSTHSIVFSHIPPGKYDLQLRLTKNSAPQGSAAQTITLPITITPPWWTTWWARLLFIATGLTIVFFFFKNRMKKYEREQKELEEKVKERTHELRQALSDKSRIISVVAHDLKNPMFAIVGAIDNISSKTDEIKCNETKTVLNDISKSAHTLQTEMLKLLEWAQAKETETTPIIRPTNIKLMVNEATSLLEGMLNEKRINLKTDIRMHNYALSDTRMLSTVVRNLITNSIKFTREGGTITISAWQDDSAHIMISDTGIGMSRATIDSIGNGTLTEHREGTNNEKGTGLGLSLCKEYISKIGGKIKIESELGKGTSIRLTLPLAKEEIEETEEVQTTEPAQIEIDKELLAGNTILIVDDDNLICQNLSSIIEPHAATLIAHDGDEALNIVADNNIDIILSDVDMPNLNGIEMAKKLLTEEHSRHIPLIFLSAQNDETNRLLGLSSGAVDYIPKPFRQDELLIKIINLLKIRRSQQERILAESIGFNQKEKTNNSQDQMNPFVKKLLGVIEEKYADGDFSIEDLCRAMCVSQSTLQRRLKAIIGKTPVEIINEYRLNKAHEMLSSAKYGSAIGDVAFAVGFRDASYFTRKFKEHFGYLPSSVEQRDSDLTL